MPPWLSSLMAPLSSDEVQQLADSILHDLSATDYACSSLHRILGGSASFTFRGILQSPLVMPGGMTASSVIVKKATDFAAINIDFRLDSRRSAYEDAMLKELSHSSFSTGIGPLLIRTPLTFLYISPLQIQVIEDLHPAKDLADIITSRNDDSLQTDFAATGFTLGAWLRSFHDWSKEPQRQHRFNWLMSDNSGSRVLKRETTYDTIVDIAKGFPVIPNKDLDMLDRVRARAMFEHKQWLMGDPTLTEGICYGLIHSDFWTGNVLFDSSTRPQLYIIDFEFAHFGHRATDLGQMIGDLLEKSYMFDSDPSTRPNCEAMITAFVRGYGALYDDMAYRIAIHAGAHMINWCARHPGAEMRGKVEGLMQRAVAIIVKAYEGDRAWFDGDVLGWLIRGSE